MVDRLDHEEQFLFKEEVLSLAEALAGRGVSVRPYHAGLDAGTIMGHEFAGEVENEEVDPEDAKMALNVGADAIVCSNHGGRQLDGAIAALRALPEVVAAVAEAIEALRRAASGKWPLAGAMESALEKLAAEDAYAEIRAAALEASAKACSVALSPPG